MLVASLGSLRKKKAQRVVDRADEPVAATTPASSEWALAVLALVFLCGIFSTEVADTDFWWHLKTGERVVTEGSLPLPDIYSFTTDLGDESYPGEERVRRFNLTHEWLAQAAWFMVYSIGGLGGVVAWKGLLLTFVLAVAGYLAWRRSGSLLAGIVCGLMGVPIMTLFAADRPTIVTFVMVAAYLLLLEAFERNGERRVLWAIPLLQLVWANAHGGFFMGWVVLGAYCAAALRWPDSKRNPLWTTAIIAFLVSALNPNGLRIFEVLLGYRESYLTKTLIEWTSPPLLGPPYSFPLLLFGSAAVIALSWRRAKWQDALLLLAFGGAAITAFRNLALVAFVAPILIATYGWPLLSPRLQAVERVWGQVALGALLVGLLGYNASAGRLFQFRVADWKAPAGAAEFLANVDPTVRMFNSYEYGGYLIWKLGPERQTFVDGRALNEAVYRDYQAILSTSNRTQRESLLSQYGVQLIVTNSFEFVTGRVYPIVTQLADPAETSWELVYQDAQALVYARSTPANQTLIDQHRLDRAQVLEQMQTACRVYIEHDPELCNCARTLGFTFGQMGRQAEALEFFDLYLANTPFPDPEAERAAATLR